MKIKRFNLFLIFFLSALFSSAYPQNNTPGKLSGADIKKIKNMMKSELCSEIENKLYIIDGSYALWVRRGNCSDNSYGYTLLGKNAAILCYQRETIAGTDKKCGKENEQFFNTIIENLDEDNLGLDKKIKVVLKYSWTN